MYERLLNKSVNDLVDTSDRLVGIAKKSSKIPGAGVGAS
jgi:hypothetical protein